MLQEERTTIGEEGHCWHDPYPYGAPDFPEPHFDLEFREELPWILEYAHMTD